MADMSAAVNRSTAVDLSTTRQPPALASSPVLRQLPPATRLVLRGGSEAIAAATAALGLQRSEFPCRAVRADGRAALWLGPDERLLIGPADAAGEWTGLLQRALAGMAHSLVETSHAQTAFEISGARAAITLNTGCPLDLDQASFPVDMCTRTVFAKAQVVLWRTSPETFRIETGRSFASYVTKILALAASELAT
ncbi:MAG TPA: sarcosine oxidase subunit gamma family protein [Steroidobacteraceae bacterium]|jgi:sarcosine oxidase subunit gamma|nr:sarcosine oxidase subunit gamma family protein [Steroidobacteraceae bacterium]